MEAKKPSILGIVWHDTGRFLSCYGSKGLKTPCTDRMAREGVLFENHFSTGTVCVPSRASILTGKYFHATRIAFYDKEEITLPRLLSAVGYRTARIGFAEDKEYRSIAGGEYTGGEAGVDVCGYDTVWRENSSARIVADKVCDFLENGGGDKPFYIQAAFKEAHAPCDEPVVEEEAAAFPLPDWLPDLPDVPGTHRFLAELAASITVADAALGKILDCLERLGLRENTLVYFTTDHGIDLPRAKQSCYDAGTGVAMLWWGPSWLAAGSRPDMLSSHADIMPTICELVEINAPEGIHGVSQLAALKGNPEKVRDHIFAEKAWEIMAEPVRSIRTKKWKYIRNFRPGWPVPVGWSFTEAAGIEPVQRIYSGPRPEEELYDLENDTYERNNLAGDAKYSKTLSELRERLMKILRDDDDDLLKPGSLYKKALALPAMRWWTENGDGTFTVADLGKK